MRGQQLSGCLRQVSSRSAKGNPRLPTLIALVEAVRLPCPKARIPPEVATDIGEIRIALCPDGEIGQLMIRPSIGGDALVRCSPTEVERTKQRVKTPGIWSVSVADVRFRLCC